MRKRKRKERMKRDKNRETERKRIRNGEEKEKLAVRRPSFVFCIFKNLFLFFTVSLH